ncbi:MAG: hypothetical protein EBV31_06315 [Verrucomicrobia bacterium]|nr:hypothetical protein [Verrucomicrobiota bacterium]
MNPRAFAAVLGLLLAPTLTVLAASEEKTGVAAPIPRHQRRQEGDFKTLVMVDCKIEDRERFDSFIDKNFPDAKLLYTDVNEHVGDDVVHDLGYGVGAAVHSFHHTELVLVSGFAKATTRIDGKTEAESTKYWNSVFTSSGKEKAIKLHLVSTNKSGGSYRILKVGKDGNYE